MSRRVEGPSFVPARYAFDPRAERPEGWGRLLRLGANGASLLTGGRLDAGDRLSLTFELPGEAFDGVWAVVRTAETDPDGYREASLRFLDPRDAKRLGRVLAGLLARTPAVGA